MDDVRPKDLMLTLLCTLLVLPLLPTTTGAPYAPPGTTADPGCSAEDPLAQALADSGAVTFDEDPEAGTWRTWWVDPADFPVPPPPALSEPQTAHELIELHGYQNNRTPFQTFKAVIVDGDGVAGRFWTEKAIEVIRLFSLRETSTPPRMAYMLGILETAIHDAMVLTWQHKYCHLRPAPYHIDPTLRPLVRERDVPSYPSEHAAAAGAAAFLLDQFFPGKVTPNGTTEEILALALESRLVAGANYRSDVDAGYALGAAVGRKVLDMRAGDGSLAIWDGAGRPDPDIVPCAWEETPPAYKPPDDVVWGDVRPLLLDDASSYLVPPPPACEGAEHLAALEHLWNTSRTLTPAQVALAEKWDLGPWTELPPGRAIGIALAAVIDHELTGMHAQRVLASVAGAVTDAGIACWDAKYTYWRERPVTTIQRLWDPQWEPLMSTPSTPAWSGGHGCLFGALTTTVAWFFPGEADAMASIRDDIVDARLYAGTTLPHETRQGLATGSDVAAPFLARAQTDGADIRYTA
ncbi:MAG: phosphatase PAP2 family protein [Euryarchaeota archaeon]|nr:phosphatase PAP2 family protein [Euryarchaeota archaeon]